MNKVTYYKNPRIDYLFGTFGRVIPTKPIKAVTTNQEEALVIRGLSSQFKIGHFYMPLNSNPQPKQVNEPYKIFSKSGFKKCLGYHY